MSKRPRRNHAPVFKAKVALDALKGEQTLVELSQVTRFIRTRLQSGRGNFWNMPRTFSARTGNPNKVRA